MLPVQGQVLPVQMSPLSPGLSPMGYYEDLGALGQELGIRMFVYIGNILADTKEKNRDQ